LLCAFYPAFFGLPPFFPFCRAAAALEVLLLAPPSVPQCCINKLICSGVGGFIFMFMIVCLVWFWFSWFALNRFTVVIVEANLEIHPNQEMKLKCTAFPEN
jgi:hypothetical protein